jgi:hypothetical protein
MQLYYSQQDNQDAKFSASSMVGLDEISRSATMELMTYQLFQQRLYAAPYIFPARNG